MNPHNIEQLVADFEARIASGASFYMEAIDLLDVMDYYLEQGNEAKADQAIAIAQHLHPDNEDVRLAVAYRQKDLAGWSEARRIVESIENQDLPDVRLFYAEEALCALNPDKADKIFQAAFHATYEPDFKLCVDYAEILLDYGFYERCIHTLNLIPNDFEEIDHVLEIKGEAYIGLEQYEEAEQCYLRGVDADGFDDISWTQLAFAQLKAKRYDKALESAEYALAINPKSEKAIDIKHSCAMAMNDIALILQSAEEYISIAPEAHIPYLTLSALYSGEESKEKSIKYIKAAAARCPLNHPDRAKVINALAGTYILCQREEEAMELIRAAESLGIDVWTTIIHYFDDAMTSKNYPHAHRIFFAYERAFPLSAEQVLEVASYLRHNSLYQEAKDVWEHLFTHEDELSPERQDFFNEAKKKLKEQ